MSRRQPWLLVFTFVAHLLAAEAPAEPPFERGLDKVRLELMAARTGLCALSVAAHPDDEDGATIAWLHRFAGVEVHMCLATRGEGGQNESGPELGDELAWKRTLETEAAARILGAEKVWYLNLPDFGYSKSAEETLKVWDHREALGRLVRVIRTVKPDILFTNHDPEGTDHGHHVATAKLLYEAFEAAADPKQFPQQLSDEGLQAWQARKLYRRLRDFERDQATLRLDVSGRDPSSGHSPAEIAAWALERHVSQGMKREVKAGEKVERFFVLAKSKIKSPPEKEAGMIEGLAQPDFEPLHMQIDFPFPVPVSLFDLLAEKDPDRSPPWELQELWANQIALHGMIWFSYWSNKAAFEKLPELNPFLQAAARRSVSHANMGLFHALGLRLEAMPEDSVVTPGEAVKVALRFANSGPQEVTLKALEFLTEPGWELSVVKAPEKPIPAGAVYETEGMLTATDASYPTYPAHRWMMLRNEAFSPVRIRARVAVQHEFTITADVPIHLAPPFTARFTEEPYLLFDDPDRKPTDQVLCRARLLVTSHRREPWTLYMRPGVIERATLQEAPDSPHAGAKFEFTREEQTLDAEVVFHTTVAELEKGDLVAPVRLFEKDAKHYTLARAVFRRVPLKLPQPLNVGIVRTYDDATWDALRRMMKQFRALNAIEIKPDDWLDADFGNLHTILLDLRCTQYRPDALQYRQRLLDFMEQGGHVVCLYHKDFDWNMPGEKARGQGYFRGEGGGGAIAPYPITLSFQRVTHEQAPVRILDANHTLLARPNRIWEGDFTGWVQERGVYFPAKWDEKYEALLSSNDPGEAALDGGLLIARVGKHGQGSFVYTSYVWYRQLRAGVPGAYRMLANLIAYPRVKDLKPDE